MKKRQEKEKALERVEEEKKKEAAESERQHYLYANNEANLRKEKEEKHQAAQERIREEQTKSGFKNQDSSLAEKLAKRRATSEDR